MKKIVWAVLLMLLFSFTGCSEQINTIAENTVNTPIEENQTPMENEIYEAEYIGNLKTKKFHLSTCETLPSDKNSIYIDSRQEAIMNSYKPCKKCNP